MERCILIVTRTLPSLRAGSPVVNLPRRRARFALDFAWKDSDPDSSLLQLAKLESKCMQDGPGH